MIDLYHPVFDELIDKISEIAALIHSYGWAEANAGNLSVDVSDLLQASDPAQVRYYLVSRAGSRYRQTALKPRDNLLLIRTEAEHDRCFPAYAKATSEWVSHRCLQLHNPRFNVILHTHPAEIIALAAEKISATPELLNDHFARILPEISLYLPQGIALCPPLPPGSLELCQASLKALQDQSALIWNGHGLLTFAEDLDQALDLQEIVVKAAKIHFLIKVGVLKI